MLGGHYPVAVPRHHFRDHCRRRPRSSPAASGPFLHPIPMPFVYTAPAMTETVTLTATSATGLAPAATANLQIGNAIANPVSLPGATQRTMPLTSTGEFCFLYDGQATAVAGFPSLFNPAVASVNIGATDGSYMSWMSAAPALATATSLSNGQFICVSAPVGSTVFAQ